ncbi:MAG: GNAT family N-acetyltransferase [Gemmatimonadetes bacterium]|nr:GNAT family N-acetyltransferase [Gemmatimonadota bacterium]
MPREPELVLRTARLHLVPLGEADLVALQALNAEPAVRRYLFDDVVWTVEETRERLLVENARLWREEGRGLFAIREALGAPLVGWIGTWYFHEPPVRELGYALHPRVWGRGYVTEAARAVLAWGAEVHGDTTVRASTDAPNEASIRVLERLGFRAVARTPGPVHDTVHFALVGRPGGAGAPDAVSSGSDAPR